MKKTQENQNWRLWMNLMTKLDNNRDKWNCVSDKQYDIVNCGVLTGISNNCFDNQNKSQSAYKLQENLGEVNVENHA